MPNLTGLNWVGVRLTTGQIVCDLPNVEISTGDLPVTIGQVETGQLAFNVTAKTPPEWLTATQPGGSAIIGWTGDPSAPTIVWGGIVMQRIRSVSPRVTLSCATVEEYLRGCYVCNDGNAYTANGINQDTIFASLMAYASGVNRLPWTLNHINPSSQNQSAAYTPSSNVTVLSALQSLSAVTGGPEWTASWSWNLAAGTITPVMTYGSRIGQAATQASPAVTITVQDLVDGASFTEDYSEGFGANSVTAYGSTAGSTSNVVPFANAQPSDLKGRPIWQYMYQPNATVFDTTHLAQYATAAVAQINDGSQPLTLTLPKHRAKKQFGGGYGAVGMQYGQDWSIGDDIGWYLSGDAFPQAVSGTARCIGYRIGYETITPILQGAKLA